MARAFCPPPWFAFFQHLLLAASLGLGLGASDALAQATRTTFSEGNHELSIEFPNGYQSRYGFHAVQVIAVNGGAAAVDWQVWINDQSYGDRTLNSGGHRERFIVPPGRTVERNILVAIGRNEERSSWSRLEAVVTTPSGETRRWSPGGSSGSRSGGRVVDSPALVAGQAVTVISNAPAEDDHYNGRLNPAAASRDWRGYSAFSSMVLRPEDWDAMSPSVHAAIGDWVRMGGHLQFVGGMPNNAPTVDVTGQPGRGFGSVHAPLADWGAATPNFANLPATQAAVASPSPVVTTTKQGFSTIRPWLMKQSPQLLRDRFVVWPMVLVLVAFFVMITPVNLFVLAPSSRRHRLFRTIPLISLAACALLALAVAVGDGVGGKGERLVWIESRPGTENREFITQWQASRSGALMRTAFTVPDAAYLAPLSEPGSAVSLRVEGDRLEAGGGWFTSRASQSHFLQAVRPGRGRIEWQRGDADTPHAVATFDFPLGDVFIQEADGTWWRAAAMRQGERTALEPIDADVVAAEVERRTESHPQAKRLREMAMRPGHYIGFTESPGAIETLRSVRWSDTGIVTGMLATP